MRLIEHCFSGPITGQAPLLTRIRELYQLRNAIVHPLWEPSSMTLGGGVLWRANTDLRRQIGTVDGGV